MGGPQQPMEAVLQEHLEAGRLYEAHQLFRTQFSRKKNRKKYCDARDGAVKGCLLLLERDEPDGAADLGKLVIDMYTEVGLTDSPDNLEPMCQVLAAFPHGKVTAMLTLGKCAIRWSAAQGEYTDGAPELHNVLAESLAEQKEYGTAQQHFLRGDRPELFGQMLDRWAELGTKTERDLFVARAVFGYLVLKNGRDANLVFENAMASVSEPSPLQNFLKYLLLCVTRDAPDLFKDLCKRYSRSLKRDPNFAQYISAIGEQYFEIRAPQNGMQAMMSQMMSQMMG